MMKVTQVLRSTPQPIAASSNQRCRVINHAACDTQGVLQNGWNASISTAKDLSKRLCGRVKNILASTGAKQTVIAAIVAMVALKVRGSQFSRNDYLDVAAKTAVETGVRQTLTALMLV